MAVLLWTFNLFLSSVLWLSHSCLRADLSAITAKEAASRQRLTSQLVNNNLTYLFKNTGNQDIGTTDAFAKGEQWLLWSHFPASCSSGQVCWRWPEQQTEPRLVFVSLLLTPIYLLSNPRQDDSRTGSVPWLTGVHNDMVEFTGHEGILCSSNNGFVTACTFAWDMFCMCHIP